MLKWEFTVSGQTLTRTDRLDTYADMVGQLQASFALDTWWDDYVVIAQFVRDGIAELRVLQNGICDVPDRALKGAGVVYVSLYAVDGSTRKTTNEIKISIEPSGIRRGSLSPSKPSETVWHQTLDLLGGLRGGTKGQITAKASDADYDFEFVDVEHPEGTENLYMINDLSNLSKFYTCSSSVEETGDSVFPYELEVWGEIKLGDWNYQTGEFDSYFNTDFGLKKEKTNGGVFPSINNGDVDIVISSVAVDGTLNIKNFFSHLYSDSIYNYYNISSDISFVWNNCAIVFEHKFKFEHDPEGWDDMVIGDLLKGEPNGYGDKLTQMGIRISVPKRTDIEVK